MLVFLESGLIYLCDLSNLLFLLFQTRSLQFYNHLYETNSFEKNIYNVNFMGVKSNGGQKYTILNENNEASKYLLPKHLFGERKVLLVRLLS